MEPVLETIDLDMEEANELLFKVKIEGADASPAKVRLVCEGGDVAYMFNGRGTKDDGVVQFVLPSMKDKLKEGTYQSRVEVLIDNRYFAPVQFNINFKKAVKVVAESISIAPRKVAPEVTVTAAPIVKPVVKAPPTPPAPVQVQKEREAPPPARENARMTLKERFESRRGEEQGDAGEELVKELARSLLKRKPQR